MNGPFPVLSSIFAFAMTFSTPSFAGASSPLPFTPPTTFTGLTPCADCAGIKVTLTLYPDGTYFLRRSYLGKGPNNYFELGKWRYDETDARMTLRSGTDAPSYYRPRDGNTLEALDTHGDLIVSPFDSSLLRADAVDRFHERMHWRGIYSYVTDAGSFRECMTDREYSVAQLGDAEALEQAYATVRKAPSAPVLVTFEGHLSDLPRTDASGSQESIVVDKMDRAWPQDTCNAAASSALAKPVSLESTQWQLIELGGKHVPVTPGQEQPSLQLDHATKRVSGSTGCNLMNGSYELEGDKLHFSPLATTRRACLNGGDQEQAFVKALGEVTSFKIDGRSLELLADGSPVAKFEARPSAP